MYRGLIGGKAIIDFIINEIKFSLERLAIFLVHVTVEQIGGVKLHLILNSLLCKVA